MRYPNTEMVAVAWLRGVSGLPTNGVATSLPVDNSSWAASGFVTVGPGQGGTPELYVPVRRPVLQVDCWAHNPNSSDKPPWGKANNLAEVIVNASYDHGTTQRSLTLPSGFMDAVVTAVIVRAEPRRMLADDASYARYTSDIQFDWRLA